MATLVIPSFTFMDSYLEGIREFQEEQNPHAANYSDWNLEEIREGFEQHLRDIEDTSKGINLPEGYVPATELWLIEDRKYLGRVHIRHFLNDYLLQIGGHIGYNIRKSERGKGHGTEALQLGLIEAKKLGLNRVLVTCDEDNLASRRVIEKNGGWLENISEGEPGEVRKMRFWFELN